MHKFLAGVAYSYVLLILVASLSKFVIGVLPADVPNSDKYGHAIAYCLFVIIWGVYLSYSKANLPKEYYVKKFTKAFFFGVSFGILMEIAQWSLTSYRQFDLFDILANTTGAILGWLILRLFLKYFK